MSLVFLVNLFVTLTFSLFTTAALTRFSWHMWRSTDGKPTIQRYGSAVLILISVQLIILTIAIMIPWLCHVALMAAEHFAPASLS